MLKRIDHVGVVVADLEAHIEQLESLGLTFGRSNENDEAFAVHYPCGEASVELIDVRDPTARQRRLPPETQATIEHIAFEVDDLKAVRDTLVRRGVEVSWPPFPSGTAQMIWTTAETSGGIQYQFLRRPTGAPPL